MTKPTKWHVRPAKTQISLGIHPVWSESSLSAWRKLGSLATHWAHSEDSDQTGWMPRLIWVFAGCTLIMLVLSCRGSHNETNRSLYTTWRIGFPQQSAGCQSAVSGCELLCHPTSRSVCSQLLIIRSRVWVPLVVRFNVDWLITLTQKLISSFVTKSGPLYNFKTVQDIFMKLHTNINQH